LKLGYITDIHLRAETPEGRTDNFNKSLLTKSEEAGQIFNDEKCDVILCGGDWTDSPDVSNSVIHDLIGILKGWNKPIIGIIGSHDYYGYEVKSLRRTPIGIIYKSGLIELIGSKGMKEYIDLGDLIICGTPHTYWLDENPENYYKPRYDSNKLQIQLTHGTLIEHSAPFQYTLITQINTESDIVLGAHYHPGWKKVHNINETKFAHPGSIARLDNTGTERIPQVLVIDTDKWSRNYTKVNDIFKFISLKTAIPHPFKEKIKESREEISMNIVNKVLNMIQTTQINIIDIKQQLPKVAQELGYSSEILEEAFSLIEEAKEK